MSLALACLVLVWAGAASAEEACESALELVESVQMDEFSLGGDAAADPEDCPAFVTDVVPTSVFLLEVRPEPRLTAFRSLLPLPTSPPPRLR